MSPQARRAARVFLVDEEGCVLMFRGNDPARPDAGSWWFTPGGGIEGDETAEAGARRELFEETGFATAELGVPVYERVTQFSFEGNDYEQHETFFRVRVARFTPSTDGWNEVERRSMSDHKWWSRAELETAGETFYPERLTEIMTEWET